MSDQQKFGRVQLKHDTQANWEKATNFIPLAGEIIIYVPDENYTYSRFKIGDGYTVLLNLPFATIEEIALDKTLSIEGAAADAKAVGEAIPEIYTQDTEPTEFSEGAIWIDTSNEIETVASDNTAMKQILNTIFHIGYIYISSSSTNPADIYGVGTWRQIKDTFILAAGDTYAAGSTGGEAEHTLINNEMPSHRHSTYGIGITSGSLNGNANEAWAALRGVNRSNHLNTTEYTAYEGGGAAHNNMPPYITKYVWERIA